MMIANHKKLLLGVFILLHLICLSCQLTQDTINGIDESDVEEEEEYEDEGDEEIIVLEGPDGKWTTIRADDEDDYNYDEGDLVLDPDRMVVWTNKELRQSFALKHAIQLYNVTQDFADKMKLAFKHDHYEDILKKEGTSLKKEMDYLEKQYLKVLQQIDVAGGVKPKTANDSTELENFALTMSLKYDAMIQNTKSFTEKLLKALVAVKQDKAGILEELKKFTTHKKLYEDTRGILESSGMYLRFPAKDAVPVEKVDMAILNSLLKYYLQIDQFDDEILPILEKYDGAIEKMDKLTAEYLIVEEGLLRVKKMEVMIKHVVKQNDNMLRHFEGITNAGIAKAQEAIPEMASMYEALQNKIMEVTKELGAQDGRIRDLHKKLNEYFKKANEEAIMKAVRDNPGKVMKVVKVRSEEELQRIIKKEGLDPMRVKVTEEGLKQFLKQEGIPAPEEDSDSDDSDEEDDDDDMRDEL